MQHRVLVDLMSQKLQSLQARVAQLLARRNVPKLSQELAHKISQEETTGLAYVFWARTLVLTLLAVWVGITLPFERSALYLGAITVFFLVGIATYGAALCCKRRTLIIGVLLSIDSAMLTYILIFPNSFGLDGWTPQLNLRSPGFLYVGVFLTAMSLSYKPALVVWVGVVTIVTWATGYLWVVYLPETQFFSSREVLDQDLDLDAVIAIVLAPNAVGFARLSNQIVFLGLVTIILTFAVWRSRRLVIKQVASETQRLALSRYFSPNIVQNIAERGFDEPSVQPVAVLFADIVGFTSISERLEPNALIGLLREFHGRMAHTAFEHDGTVDKFIGDAIMVHFGTPQVRNDDAVRALKCAAQMIREVEAWNEERALNGEEPVRVGIGLHYGDVIVGNIGDERRMEFTVLGDTVNVASRLEHLTRKLGASVVVSADLVAGVERLGFAPDQILPALQPDQAMKVRGRASPVTTWHDGPR